MPEKTMRDAINEALHQAMEQDDSVFVIGEDVAGCNGSAGDVGSVGGVFGVGVVRPREVGKVGGQSAGVPVVGRRLRVVHLDSGPGCAAVGGNLHLTLVEVVLDVVARVEGELSSRAQLQSGSADILADIVGIGAGLVDGGSDVPARRGDGPGRGWDRAMAGSYEERKRAAQARESVS